MNYKIYRYECPREFLYKHSWDKDVGVSFLFNGHTPELQYAVVNEEKATYLRLRFPYLNLIPIDEI